MGAVAITPVDLRLTAVDEDLAEDVIAAVLARAARFAPCIASEAFPYDAAAKAVLVDIVLRRYDARVSVVQPGTSKSETVGQRTQSVDTKGVPATTFWPAEIVELQALCTQAAATVVETVTPAWSFPEARPWPC